MNDQNMINDSKSDVDSLIDINEIMPKYYSEKQRVAQQKYRAKYPEKNRATQREIYQRKKQDPEWKARFNERSKIHNMKYQTKKREALYGIGAPKRGRGRPRKE
jgi:hypothetical protein